MNLFGLTITRTKAAPMTTAMPLSTSGGWWRVIREPFTGAWQRNEDVRMDTVLTYFAVFACTTLIASDIAKLNLRLVQKDDDGIWFEIESPSFSPVLRKPNRYQTIKKFKEQWIVSKLAHGNTYVLKERDQRGVVVALYVLDPTRVTPLVATDGSVWYQLSRDDLSGLRQDSITLPASEIIHDTMVALYHPLIGVSPIYASGIAAMQGLNIQTNSQKFFANGANPSGMLSAPGAISDETAARLKAIFDSGAYSGDNVGKVIVAGDGLEYKQFTVNAVDSQMIEQLKWTADNVCSCYHVPAYMVGVGDPPPYANIEPLIQQYFSQCLQTLILDFETVLDEGLGLSQKIDGRQMGVELDIKDLIWMDTSSKTTSATTAVGGSVLTINEARKDYFGKGKVPGGDTIWMQQQDYSVQALMERDRDKPFAKPTPAELPPAAEDDDDIGDEEKMLAAAARVIRRKALDLRRRHAA